MPKKSRVQEWLEGYVWRKKRIDALRAEEKNAADPLKAQYQDWITAMEAQQAETLEAIRSIEYEKVQEAIRLRYIAGMPVREICYEMPHARSVVFELLKQGRAVLEEKGYPRVQGKGLHPLQRPERRGITPACAGKRAVKTS